MDDYQNSSRFIHRRTAATKPLPIERASKTDILTVVAVYQIDIPIDQGLLIYGYTYQSKLQCCKADPTLYYSTIENYIPKFKAKGTWTLGGFAPGGFAQFGYKYGNIYPYMPIIGHYLSGGSPGPLRKNSTELSFPHF